MKRYIMLIFILLCSLFSIHCSSETNKFTIISGSENKSLEELVKEFGKKNGYDVEIHYKGSVDIMLELESNSISGDAVWPANSFWLALGDKQKKVKNAKSIMTSPVVLGVKAGLAQKLGLIDKTVNVQDILKLVEEKKLKFMMTSATQSNSGASLYLSLLYALLENPDVITKEDLNRADLKERIKLIFSGVNRSSESSGFLKELFLSHPEGFDAMVNYEALIIETNLELEKRGLEPLHVIYIENTTAMSDSPLGYIHRNEPKKEEFFEKLQDYLLSEQTQNTITSYGRRTGVSGVSSKTDTGIFNPNWGISTDKILTAMRVPAPEVIKEALTLYQTTLRKPSLTVYCLDFSGSMAGSGEQQLKEAMKTLLLQDTASKYLLQAAPNDITIVIPFSDRTFASMRVNGNDKTALLELFNKINEKKPTGGTDIYSPVIIALDKIIKENTETNIPAIVLMTDGQSNTGRNFQALAEHWRRAGIDIPVFSILFGEADEKQLKEIASLTSGGVFDGRTNLITAFRKAKGQN
ncbi:MAG: substrate-binding domain-containing protein [Candidatus Magnetoovum sp. WYHC-5]|nr:substrate-binding domain-containing protein [Candidatus Magnetoovum sp. WYHC-5]